MLKRELIATELWRRLSTLTGYKTDRNPETPPTAEDMPCVNFYELPDMVTSSTKGRKHPSYKREFDIAIEIFVKGTTAEASSRALTTAMAEVAKVLYEDPADLGGLGELEERGSTRVAVFDAANHIKAIGVGYFVKYQEAVDALFST